MKKALLIAVALLSIGFTSCKKDWKCVCTDSTLGETDEFEIKNARRPEASTWCNTFDYAYDECTLK